MQGEVSWVSSQYVNRWVLILASLSVLYLVGCGPSNDLDGMPTESVSVNLGDGSIAGVKMGDSLDRVERLWGDKVKILGRGRPPMDRDVSKGPSALSCPIVGAARVRTVMVGDVEFVSRAGRVCGAIVYGDWLAENGLSSGDDTGEVGRVLPGSSCYVVNQDVSERAEYPGCSWESARGVKVVINGTSPTLLAMSIGDLEP